MKAPFSREFTLEVDGRPILAFEAGGDRKAQQIFNESWLLDDLSLLRSGGVSLRTAQSKLSVRPATPKKRLPSAKRRKMITADDMPLVYLIDLDGQENRS
jgi:hypothetical protein